MTIIELSTAPVAARRGPDPVECPECGGDVLPEGRKVPPHNVRRFGPLRLDGAPLTDPRGGRVYGVYEDTTKVCPGGPKAADRPAGPRKQRAPKCPEDVVRRLVEKEHLTDQQAAARLGCDPSTVRKARQRANPPIPPGRGNPTLAGYQPPQLDECAA